MLSNALNYRLTYLGYLVYQKYREINSLPKKRKLHIVKIKNPTGYFINNNILYEEKGKIDQIISLRENQFNFIDWDGLYGEKKTFITHAYGMDWSYYFNENEYEIITPEQAVEEERLNDINRRKHEKELENKRKLEKEQQKRTTKKTTRKC